MPSRQKTVLFVALAIGLAGKAEAAELRTKKGITILGEAGITPPNGRPSAASPTRA